MEYCEMFRYGVGILFGILGGMGCRRCVIEFVFDIN